MIAGPSTSFAPPRTSLSSKRERRAGDASPGAETQRKAKVEEMKVRATRARWRAGTGSRSAVLLSVLCAVVGMNACGCGGSVAKSCMVSGVVRAADGATGVPCSVGFSGDDPSSPSISLKTGDAFSHSFVVLAPSGTTFNQELTVACEGYVEQSRSIPFKLGMLSCPDVAVGNIALAKKAAPPT
jgi:hypothetical protein